VTSDEKKSPLPEPNSPPEVAYGASSMQAEATRLMTAAKNGDREAFDRLVEGLRSQAFRVAVGLVGSREDAMELSQEAFLKTYRARASYREGEPFLPWFHRILRNCCYSHLRQRGRLRKSSLSAHAPSGEDEGDWEIEDEGPAPHEAAQQDERAQAFWRAFRTLSARDREILALRHFEERSYQEIADTLSIPIGTVMSRLFHARRRLRDALGGLLEEDVLPAAPIAGPTRSRPSR
jgi:RNA polymerase sigma-70 factor (ECF subfamily)